MIVASLPRYEVTIAIGNRARYSDFIHPDQIVRTVCQEFVDTEKTCVTLTKTEFIYVEGNEPGFYINLINYPRFPKRDYEVFSQAEKLSYILMSKLEQERCSLITPTHIYLFENPEYVKSEKTNLRG